MFIGYPCSTFFVVPFSISLHALNKHYQEDQEYVDSILEDVRWVQSSMSSSSSSSSSTSSNINNVNDPWFGPVRKTSDYFETIYKSAIHLIQSGNAYVESCTAEEMKINRGSLKEAGVNSPFRNRSVDENIKIFEEVKNKMFCF